MLKCPLCKGEVERVPQKYSGEREIYSCKPCFHYFTPGEVGKFDKEKN